MDADRATAEAQLLMPVYEIVCCFPDGREELRLDNRPVEVGETITIAGRDWEVVRSAPPVDPEATRRFVCAPLTVRSSALSENHRQHLEMEDRLALLRSRVKRAVRERW